MSRDPMSSNTSRGHSRISSPSCKGLGSLFAPLLKKKKKGLKHYNTMMYAMDLYCAI